MRKKSNSPIGIFDSGVGGLTVASAIRKLLPNEQIIYFGDTAHLPYGDKSPEAILHYSKRITDFLMKFDCKVILAACNTVSATVWDELKDYIGRYAIPMNVIDPVVNALSIIPPGSHVGVIGTKNTINSDSYAKKFQQTLNRVKVSSLATPLFVPMIEEGFINNEISEAIIRAYLSDKKLENIDVLILGCTHYPIIRTQILNYYKSEVEVPDTASVVALHLSGLLASLNLLNKRETSPDKFFISDHTEYFGKIATLFFKNPPVLQELNLWK